MPSNTVNLGNKGLTEGDTIDSYLQNYFVDGNEVVVPEGTYHWDGNGLETPDGDATLRGDPTATLETGDGVTINSNVDATHDTIRLQGLIFKGVWESGRIAPFARDPSAKVVVDRCHRPDGGTDQGNSIGYYVPPENDGEVVIRDCYVGYFPNNGVYASASTGPVHVEGGLYLNNNIANVRLGSQGSSVKGAVIRYDERFQNVVGPGGGRVGRSIWIREGGDGITIEDNDVTIEDGAGASGVESILIPNTASSQNARCDDNRIHNEEGEPAIYCHPDVDHLWDGSGNHVTGSGNTNTVNSSSWVACSGGGCDIATLTKRWWSNPFDHYLEVRAKDGVNAFDYTFEVDGSTTWEGRTEIQGNDSITDNGNGTYTVSGRTGNGYSDDWLYTGDVTSWSAGADTSKYTLYLDGQVVSPSELTTSTDTDPVASTDATSSVTTEEATLNGSLDDLGGASSAECYFEYRETTASSWNTTAKSTKSSTGLFSTTVWGLSNDTDYEYRSVVDASDGDSATGSIVAFTTQTDTDTGTGVVQTTTSSYTHDTLDNSGTASEKLDHPLVQPHDRSDIQRLLRALTSANDRIDVEIAEMEERRFIDGAVGTELDRLGANVGVERKTGEKDDRFRRRVQAGYKRATAHGLYDELGVITLTLLDDEAGPGDVNIKRASETADPATCVVEVSGSALDESPFTSSDLANELGDAVPGGHRVEIVLLGSFEFFDGTHDEGFGQGTWTETVSQ